MTRKIWIDDKRYVPCMDCPGDRCADPQYVCVKPKESRFRNIHRKIWGTNDREDLINTVIFGFFSFVTMLLFTGAGIEFATGQTASGAIQLVVGTIYLGITCLVFHILVSD